jgi:hypothetical protein
MVICSVLHAIQGRKQHVCQPCLSCKQTSTCTHLLLHCSDLLGPSFLCCCWGLFPVACKQVADEINTQHTNSRRLPGHSCPEELVATTDLEGMVAASTLLLLAVPSAHIAGTAKRCVEHLKPDAVLVCCAKGAWQRT